MSPPVESGGGGGGGRTEGFMTSSFGAGISLASRGGGGGVSSRSVVMSHSGGACQVEGIVGGATFFPKLELQNVKV